MTKWFDKLAHSQVSRRDFLKGSAAATAAVAGLSLAGCQNVTDTTTEAPTTQAPTNPPETTAPSTEPRLSSPHLGSKSEEPAGRNRKAGNAISRLLQDVGKPAPQMLGAGPAAQGAFTGCSKRLFYGWECRQEIGVLWLAKHQ